MKLQSSPYLSRVTPLLKRLVAALRERFPYASVLAQDTLSMQYAVSSHGVGAIETSFLTGRGFVARVHNGHGLAEYAFNEIRTRCPRWSNAFRRSPRARAARIPCPPTSPPMKR